MLFGWSTAVIDDALRTVAQAIPMHAKRRRRRAN